MILIIIASVLVLYLIVSYFLDKGYVSVEDYLTEDKKIKTFDILVPEKNFIIDGYKIQLKYSDVEIGPNNYFRKIEDGNLVVARAYIFVEGVEIYNWCTIKFGEVIRRSNEEFIVRNHESDIENATLLLEKLNEAVKDYEILKKAKEIVDREQLMWYNKI